VRAVLLIAIAAGLALAAPVSAAPDGRIASRCSATGDVCYGVFDDHGTIRFQLTLAAKYFTRYRICVKPPRGATTCKSFPVKRVGSQFGGAVRWTRNFPVRGLGKYRATWKQGAQALGPGLLFEPSKQI
jgi:hypothetical protein